MSSDTPSATPRSHLLLWSALVVSLVAVAGSLYLSLGMDLKACPLCFYQRTFAMSVLAVLAFGLCAGGGWRPGMLGLLALPLAVAGLGVAAFHVSLELSDTLECPAGVLGIGTAPRQSLAMFVVMTTLLAIDVLRGAIGWALAGVIAGGLLALACCTTNPPLPDPPTRAYSKPPDVCRRPYLGSTGF